MHLATGQQHHAVSYHTRTGSRRVHVLCWLPPRDLQDEMSSGMESITNHEQTSADVMHPMEMEDRTILHVVE